MNTAIEKFVARQKQETWELITKPEVKSWIKELLENHNIDKVLDYLYQAGLRQIDESMLMDFMVYYQL